MICFWFQPRGVVSSVIVTASPTNQLGWWSLWWTSSHWAGIVTFLNFSKINNIFKHWNDRQCKKQIGVRFSVGVGGAGGGGLNRIINLLSHSVIGECVLYRVAIGESCKMIWLKDYHILNIVISTHAIHAAIHSFAKKYIYVWEYCIFSELLNVNSFDHKV